MMRSPLAYPLNRTADVDGGGAADLQTDIMRFMAILALCLVAIFALVQSIPMTPIETPAPPTAPAAEQRTEAVGEPPAPVANKAARQPADNRATESADTPNAETVPAQITLTRPAPIVEHAAAVVIPVPEVAPAEPEKRRVSDARPGFTLRFESDAALMRAVAAGKVGVYAISAGRAKRMTARNSRISFWDASTPSTFHEMEKATVPTAVVDALSRTGVVGQPINWGVTLPAKARSQLDVLMRSHSGGSLLIGPDGEIYREAS